MNRHGTSILFFGALLIAGCVSLHAQTNSLVIPAEAENTFLNDYIDPLFVPNHVQLVYAADDFANAPGDVLKITGFAFRLDEGTADINASFSTLLIQMEVFRGTMQELVARGSGISSPSVVFSAQATILAKSGGLNDFPVRITLARPFLYDRRRGNLVVAFHHNDYSGTGGALDAQFYNNVSRGVVITPSVGSPDEPPSPPYIDAAVVGTKFSYEVVSASIQSLKVSSADITISFRIQGNPTSYGIESARLVEGPFVPTETVSSSLTVDGSIEAIIPYSSDTQYFRIMMQ